ncbi:MAG: hypothetical protein MUC78_07105 [Bacteroidales bacterium]|jgi:hypothetical protein|nr:hypothetical protein [Bacteroidales bacterium]
MKKLLLFLFFVLAVVSCRKTEIEPEGPTDVRVYNNTEQVFENVIVNTSGGEFNFGTVASHAYSAYHRYDKAFPKADISLTIGGITYRTPQQDYTYMQYMGRMKISYKIFISNQTLKELDTDVVPEGDL